MSMNLYVETEDGKEINLWQTPTWVTDMCLINHKQKYRKWKDTRYLYLEWVKSHTQGRWDSTEEADDMRSRVQGQINALTDVGKLKFYTM